MPLTDHVISGPMRGLKKLYGEGTYNIQMDGHRDSMTDLAQRAESGKIMLKR